MFARNLSRLGILAAALLASTAAPAQISDDVVKIGVLTDMNGPAATPTGQGSVTSAQMAIDDFGGKVLGKPISIVIGDHQLKADIGGGIPAAMQRSASLSVNSTGATGSTPFSRASSALSSGVSEVGRRWGEVMARLCPESGRK